MDRNRVLELALEELNRQKAGVEAEIESLRAELEGTGSAVPQPTSFPSAGIRRQRTPAEREAQANRMKMYWAAKRAAKTAKPADKKKSSS